MLSQPIFELLQAALQQITAIVATQSNRHDFEFCHVLDDNARIFWINSVAGKSCGSFASEIIIGLATSTSSASSVAGAIRIATIREPRKIRR